MKPCLWPAVTVAAISLLGCGQQELGGCGPLGKQVCAVPTSACGPTTFSAPTCVNGIWTCPADLGPTISCEPPVCPATLLPGCTCDAATGVTTCRDAGACPSSAPDGSVLFCVQDCSDHTAIVSTCDGGVWSCPPGTMDGRDCPRDGGADAQPNDAGSTCPSREQDGGILGCVCGSDTGPEPRCDNGAWVCPPASGPVSVCRPSPPRCTGSTPTGCFCNPITGVLACQPDGGADAGPTNHGG